VEEHQVSLDAEQLYYLPSGTYDGRPLRPPPGLGYPQQRKPWVPQNIDECQAKYCHYCRPSCEPRSYLSLNRIANGDIPPSAATGFGFHRLRTRPVIDVNIVRDIGLRAVPWVRRMRQVAFMRYTDSVPASSPVARLPFVAIFGVNMELVGYYRRRGH